MELEEAIKIYRDCKKEPEKHSCEKCPIYDKKFIGDGMLCNFITEADIRAHNIKESNNGNRS